jgi:pyruvate/2-oxoglutarate dehydrogenase complex dihydrolipoamide acyltransferase (E2) component
MMGSLNSPIAGETQAADRSQRPFLGKAKASPAARRLARERSIQLDKLSGSGPKGVITKSDVEKAILVEKRESERAAGRKISPVARRLAKEHGLNVDQVAGTGPGGTITKADVQRHLEAPRETQPATAEEESLEEPKISVIPLGDVRRVMSQRLTTSHQSIVQATTVADVDMTEIVRLRQRIPASFTAFVVKAAARAVAAYPFINASLDDDQIHLHNSVHMGVAVSLDEGLLVPVIRHAEHKSLAQIHQEIKDLSERARGRGLSAEELSGATMTITNSGVFGSLLFTPIIVAPQSATLGMGKVAPTPVVREGQIVARDILYLCLSYDHRFLDGAIAVRYLQKVRAHLEDPIALLWDGQEKR